MNIKRLWSIEPILNRTLAVVPDCQLLKKPYSSNLRWVVHHAQLLEAGEDGPLVEVVQLAPVQDQVLGAEQLSLPQ